MPDKVQISDRTHPLYDKNLDLWSLYYASAQGGENFITDANLFSHRLEDSDDYQERLDRAYFLNFCDTIPTIYNSYIFKSEIERKPDVTLDLFRRNVDGIGTDISEFTKRIGYLASVYGVMHVLVDMPQEVTKTKRTKSKGLSRADTKNVTPYVSAIHPVKLKDWSVDAFGKFRWVVIELEHYEDSDVTVERVEQTLYKVITLEEWWIEDEDGGKVKFEDGSISEGTNELGIIPIVTMYHKDLSNNKVGESLLKDIVYVNRIIMNWCSCIDEMIERQTFSQLTIPDDGTMSELKEGGSDPLQTVGTSSIWTYPSDSKTPPSFISPDAENLSTVWQLVADHIKEIYRMSGLIGGTSDLYAAKSGRQSQMSFLGTNSALAEKAATYQKFENQISMIAYLHLGKSIEEYEEVSYPTQFDVTALSDEINDSFAIMERNFSPIFNKVLQKNIVRKAIPTAPQSLRESIENEIETGDGIVEPIRSGLGDKGMTDGGDGNPNSNLGDSNRTSAQNLKENVGKQKKE